MPETEPPSALIRDSMSVNGIDAAFPPSGNGVDAPRLAVFEVINLKPLFARAQFGLGVAEVDNRSLKVDNDRHEG